MKPMILGVCLFVIAHLTVNVKNASAVVIPEETVQRIEKMENVEISPVEDLMREHGVLSRILLIYKEIALRLDNNQPFPLDAIFKTTEIIRGFIQNYHEKLEEKYIFSRFLKAHTLVDLTKLLDRQHQTGRKIIEEILTQEKMKNADDKKKLAENIRSFIRMYRPHKAREDTILFPAFHTIVTTEEFKELGAEFENEEHRLFGEQGFEKIVSQVEDIEKKLRIYDLSQFTPAKYKYLPMWEEKNRESAK